MATLDAVLLIGGSAFALLVSSLAEAQLFESFPLHELGKRPVGSGLLTYVFHYFKDGVGVQGYDPVQGALSPPLRLRVHAACVCGLWAMILFSFRQLSSFVSMLPEGDWVSIGVTGLVALSAYMLLFYRWYYVMPGVSHPGGPRAHKIQRQPQWENKVTSLPSSVVSKWRCAVSRDSHDVTEQAFQQLSNKNQPYKLTGEADGRQMWTTVAAKDVNGAKSQAANEALVLEMAAGGRPYQGFNPAVNPNSCDMLFRAQQIRNYIAKGKTPPSTDTKPATVKEAIYKGAHFYSMLQTDDGHWAGDYGGPHFLMQGLIVAWYIMGKPAALLNDEQTFLMIHYLKVHQQVDGGWGTHIESPSTMFGTTLSYVALRLLGVDANDPTCVKGREFLKRNGGAIYTASWCKFYLCVLGCMEWDGHNSVPPEMWLLPNWTPFHPGRMWCHARMVYLPMGFLYGSRFVYEKATSDPTIQALREELYCQPYESIPWSTTRHMVAPMDNYSPIPWVMKTAQDILACYEKWSIFQLFKRWVRQQGLQFCLEYMGAEDLQTNFIDIGPVNKVLNMLSFYHVGGGKLDDPKIVRHMMRVPDYLWVAEDGMKMQGYNGSQSWDTSFAIQAFAEANVLDDFPEVSRKVWSYLERCQILSTEVSQASPAFKFEANEYRAKYYRHVSEGGWPFSTSAHGWPISDCTGEGLKGVLCLLKSKAVADDLRDGTLLSMDEIRFQKAAAVLLLYQNEDGGWATYENNRGFGWYEQLNPSEVFGDIMIDYSYVELSMAALTGLVDFHERFPAHRSAEIQQAIRRGNQFFKSIQRDDGSWYGSWACCFCYGCWFGVEGLIKSGEPLSSPNIKKACEFLLRHQRANGGWGEDFTSCYDKDYAENGMGAYGDCGSGVISTAWALMALAIAKCEDVTAVRRGVHYLMSRQLPSGDWPQEGIAGVFNRACGITYTAYRNVFPIWALGRCAATYGDALNR